MSVHRQKVSLFCSVVCMTALLAWAAGAVSQGLPSDLDSASGARLPFLMRQDLGEEGLRLADIFARNGEPTDPVSGPLAFAAYNVPVAMALLDLHDGAVGQGSLDADVRELAILIACRETNYTLEWNAHVQIALNAGVDQEAIDAVRLDQPLSSISRQDAAVVRFGRELLGDRKMSPATFAEAVELFGQRGAMDLVAVMSTYAVSGFYAIAVDEHPPGAVILQPLR